MELYKDFIKIKCDGEKLVMNFLKSELHINCERLAGKKKQTKGDIFCKNLNLYIELKTEKEKTSENFFIETWSNKQKGIKGWLYNITADYLFYLFLKERCLYIIKLEDLKRAVEIGRYREVKQKKYTQLDDVWGLLIPRYCIVTKKHKI
jgi:hypothetical protein